MPNDPAAATSDLELEAKCLELEERAFNAWPALQTLVAGGWLLRFADGYTKRANSVNAWHPTLSAQAIVTYASPLFAARKLPLIVRISPLAGDAVDTSLAQLGFVHAEPTIVMTAPLQPGQGGPVNSASPQAQLSARPDPAWLAGHATANGIPDHRRAVHDRMLALIAHPTAFASLELTGQPVAWGMAVSERGMTGLFDIATSPAARRQGAARRLVAALLAWAADRGDTGAYLQVTATNAAAIALYRQLGFTEAYRYYYRIAPA